MRPLGCFFYLARIEFGRPNSGHRTAASWGRSPQTPLDGKNHIKEEVSCKIFFNAATNFSNFYLYLFENSRREVEFMEFEKLYLAIQLLAAVITITQWLKEKLD